MSLVFGSFDWACHSDLSDKVNLTCRSSLTDWLKYNLEFAFGAITGYGLKPPWYKAKKWFLSKSVILVAPQLLVSRFAEISWKLYGECPIQHDSRNICPLVVYSRTLKRYKRESRSMTDAGRIHQLLQTPVVLLGDYVKLHSVFLV